MWKLPCEGLLFDPPTKKFFLSALGSLTILLVHIHLSQSNPRSLFEDEDACCSIWMIRAINNNSAERAGEFFATCEEALASFEIPIMFEISHMDLEGFNLSAEGYAHLVVRAARGDRTRAIDFFDSLGSKVLCGRRKISKIMQLIRHYTEQQA